MMDLTLQDNVTLMNKMEPGNKNNPPLSVKPQGKPPSISQIYLNGKVVSADQFHENDGSMAILMQIILFCHRYPNDKKAAREQDLEKLLLDFAASKGFHKKLFDKIIPKIAEIRKDDELKTTSAIIGLNGQYRLVIKDTPEMLFGRCAKIILKGKTVPLTISMVAGIKNIYCRMINDNLKVIMLAFKDLEKLPENLDAVFQAKKLTLVGMIGLRDSLPANP